MKATSTRVERALRYPRPPMPGYTKEQLAAKSAHHSNYVLCGNCDLCWHTPGLRRRPQDDRALLRRRAGARSSRRPARRLPRACRHPATPRSSQDAATYVRLRTSTCSTSSAPTCTAHPSTSCGSRTSTRTTSAALPRCSRPSRLGPTSTTAATPGSRRRVGNPSVTVAPRRTRQSSYIVRYVPEGDGEAQADRFGVVRRLRVRRMRPVIALTWGWSCPGFVDTNGGPR